MVEDALLKAKTEADSCLPAQQLITKAALVDAPAVSVATSVTSAPAAALTKESYVLLTDTLFNFDKSARQDMSVGGLLRLADVAQRLKGYKSIQTLTVSGYTGGTTLRRYSRIHAVWRTSSFLFSMACCVGYLARHVQFSTFSVSPSLNRA